MELKSLETQTARQDIVNAILGPDDITSGPPFLGKRLSHFYNHYAREREILDGHVSDRSSAEEQLQKAIASLTSHVSTSRNLITLDASNLQSGALLDCAVRVMLMTECNTKGRSFGGLKKFTWEDEETLTEFIDRVYCKTLPGAAGADRNLINLDNLKVHTLVKRAGIELQGTDKISDHLTLVCGEGVKIILIFSHQSFLECNLERLRSDREDLGHSTAEALAIGCLPPQLVIETLKTFVLLFPLLQVGNDQSQRMLRKWVENEDLDKTLVDRHHVLAKLFAGGQPDPEDTRALLQQYPYWGAQLARLLREVDEPTAVTWLERHAERRRSPRHMYKCAMAALIVTAVFGMLATVLAAVQVWISYCAWVEDPSRAMCGAGNGRSAGVQE